MDLDPLHCHPPHLRREVPRVRLGTNADADESNAHCLLRPNPTPLRGRGNIRMRTPLLSCLYVVLGLLPGLSFVDFAVLIQLCSRLQQEPYPSSSSSRSRPGRERRDYSPSPSESHPDPHSTVVFKPTPALLTQAQRILFFDGSESQKVTGWTTGFVPRRCRGHEHSTIQRSRSSRVQWISRRARRFRSRIDHDTCQRTSLLQTCGRCSRTAMVRSIRSR